MKKNKIIQIGYIGLKCCYLNIPLEEAIERYCLSKNISLEEYENNVDISTDIIEFDDEFGAYDICELYN